VLRKTRNSRPSINCKDSESYLIVLILKKLNKFVLKELSKGSSCFLLKIEKTKYFFMVLLMIAAFGTPLIFNVLSAIDFLQLLRLSIFILRIGTLIISLLLLWFSVWISIKNMTKKGCKVI
ncbi:MAG: hypothetical protein RSD08_06565, partial [Oscillospiraceae bacterium]